MRSVLSAAYQRVPFKPQMFAALKKLPIPEAVFRHLHFTGPFTVKVDASHSFRINHYGDAVNNELFWRGLSSYEPTSMDIWIKMAAKSDVIVDGGAHLGLYSLVAGAVNPSATILAFEPGPIVYNRLVANAELNSFRIRPEKIGLSDKPGSATFYTSPNLVGSSLDDYFSQHTATSTVSVNTVRLDDYLAEHRIDGVDLIKLDVERHEPAVFRGMADLLDRTHPSIITEILDREVGQQLMHAVHGKDYRFFIIKEGEGIFPVSALSPPPGKIGQNFLLCSERACRELGLIG